LSRHIVARGRPAGEGWMSAGELAPIMKLTVRNVRPKLVALALSGDLERAEGSGEHGQPCTYFRPVTRDE
jgi:predicted ArsR family transcriptional regulator